MQVKIKHNCLCPCINKKSRGASDVLDTLNQHAKSLCCFDWQVYFKARKELRTSSMNPSRQNRIIYKVAQQIRPRILEIQFLAQERRSLRYNKF